MVVFSWPARVAALASSFFIAAATASLSPSSSASSPVHLVARNEEFQFKVTPDFPHTVGYERLKSWIDPSVNPCEDFYAHACGGFIRNYERLDNNDVLEMMGKSNSLLMEGILNQTSDLLAKSPVDKELFDKTRAYYDSCKDTRTIRLRGFDPILSYAREIIANTERGISLPAIFGLLHQDGVYPLFKASYTKVEANNPRDLRLQFLPAPAYEVSPATVRKVLEAFIYHGVLRLPDDTDLDEIANWIVGLEVEGKKFIDTLNQGHERGEGMRATQFMDMNEFNQRTRHDWRQYVGPLNMTGADKMYFWGDTDTWIETLNAFTHYDPKDLRYFFIWRLGVSHFNKLSEKYYTIWAKEIQPRAVRSFFDDPSDQSDIFQQDCVQETGVQLNYLAGHLFVKYAFNETQKHAAQKLVDELIEAFGNKLHTLSWMDDETKQAALGKLENMIDIVGYPDWLADANKVSEYYTPVHFAPKTYFENAVQAQVFTFFSPSVHQIGQAFQRDRLFIGYPWQLNAFHITDYVQIQINPGILQRPLFSARNPRAMNYGSLGMVIGHEITHGFDSKGRMYNKDGERKPWWSKKSQEMFDHGAKCFIDQYNHYTVRFHDGTTERVNGEQTLSENIADNGGVGVAWDAWKRAEEKAKKEGRIGGHEEENHEFTKEQMFFLAFGQTWCTARADAQVKQIMAMDEHAPNSARVNGVMHNSPEFAKAFGCPVGSPMNLHGDEGRCFLY